MSEGDPETRGRGLILGSGDRRLVERIVAQLRLAERHSEAPDRVHFRTRLVTPRLRLKRGSIEHGSSKTIADVLERVRRETDMDVAVLGRIWDGKELIIALAGDGQSFGINVGAAVPLEETFCQHLLAGRLHNIASDARSDPLVKDLAVTKLAEVGAYIGVPIVTLQARLYVLCCLSREQRPHLSQRHVLVLRRLAETIAPELGARG